MGGNMKITGIETLRADAGIDIDETAVPARPPKH
jgi:hypothetical protein